jgi:hypothetical protein
MTTMPGAANHTQSTPLLENSAAAQSQNSSAHEALAGLTRLYQS